MPPRPRPGDRVIVVGGGVAGLVAARELVLAGHEVLLLESSPRLGGRLVAHSVAGIRLDAGPDAYSARDTVVPRLLGALGLDDEIETARTAPTWLHRADGGAAPLPAGNLLGIPGVPLARDVIDVVGMGAALRAQLDNLTSGLVASKAETLGELVRRRMGRGVLERLVDPVARAVHFAPADELDVERVAPGLRALMVSAGGLGAAVRARGGSAPDGAPLATLRGGLHRLTEALAAELERFGVQVRLGVEVTAADAEGVTTSTGERLVGEVVLASPLGLEVARVRTTSVTLAVDAPELAAHPRGLGVLVAPAAPDVAARRLSHLTAAWGWIADATPLHLLRLDYDADAAEEVTPELAQRDAEVLLGVPLPHPIDTAVVAHERTAASRDVAHAIDGMHRVGEAESGTDLGAVIARARSVVEEIPTESAGAEG